MGQDQVVRIAWYRLRVTFARRWTGYLSVVLLIGLVGGVAMASIAAARRTQSSYPTFIASTNPSQLTMTIYSSVANGGPGPSLTAQVQRLPDVKVVRTEVSPPLVPLAVNGAPRLSTLGYVITIGSLDGLMYNQDRLAVVSGHRASASSADQITMTAGAARIFGVHLGETVPFGLYDNAQQSLPGFGTPSVKPILTVHLKIVGISDLTTQVVQDDVDQSFGFVFISPALLRELIAKSPDHATPAIYAIQLTSPMRSIADIENELVAVVPRGYTYEFHVTARVTAETELAVKPESVALGAFGMIAALACLVIGAQAVSRVLRQGQDERRVMRSLGASPATTALDGLLGVYASVLLGSLVAVAVATAMSPLGPIGPVRPVYPDPGVAADWTVLGSGFAALVLGLGAAATFQALRTAPHRTGLERPSSVRRSSVLRVAQSAGLSVAGVVGVHFALEPGRGRTAVPVRSVLAGTVLAVAMVVSTVTFASGLTTLVSHPSLYGWNWNYMLNPTNNLPPKALAALNHDPDVAAWSGYDYTDAEINGETFPILLTNLHDTVAPPILSGHEVNANDQIVLGAATMAALHKRVGDSVSVSYGSKVAAPDYVPPTKMIIVGTATLPAVGYSSYVAEHTSMGTGAIVPLGIQPPAMTKAMMNSDPNLNGPELAFIRMRSGISTSAARANMAGIIAVANKEFTSDPNATGNGVTQLGVQRPAQIVNYRSVGSTPVVLAVGLALGAVVALALTLVASVRRRRRDLALLKTLGFTRRQLTAAITWQAMVDAVVGIIVGIPLGVVAGRELWTLFARNINAVPDATVPVTSVVLIGVGTLVFTALVAVLPGLSAARTSTALVLRAE
jgi:hypothetical protein